MSALDRQPRSRPITGVRPQVALPALLVVALAASPSWGEDRPSVGQQLNVIRWKEDYSFLRGRTEPTAMERLKFIPLNSEKTAYVTLGGQLRERAESYEPSFFGLPGGPSFTSYATRLLADADFHWGRRFRTFLELGSFWESGRKPASRPIDRGDLELQQGFVDVVGVERPDSRVTLRIGRQEVPLGSGRLVSIRDASNARLSFDAAKLSWQKGRRNTIEVLVGRPVESRQGIFDSVTSRREWFWFADWTGRSAKDGHRNEELFYLGRKVKDAVYARGVGDESRHTLGGRLWGRVSSWDYSLQASYQSGSFGSADIRAWGVATDTGYNLAIPWRPRAAVRADIASGDEGDPGVLRSFSAPYPALNYFSEAAIFAPSNAADLHPYLQAEPLKNVVADVGVDFVWRLRTTDAVYRAGGGILVPRGISTASFVTAIIQLDTTWQMMPQFGLRAAVVWSSAGAVVRSAGGKGSRFVLVSADLRL